MSAKCHDFIDVVKIETLMTWINTHVYRTCYKNNTHFG